MTCKPRKCTLLEKKKFNHITTKTRNIPKHL
jgi:hypothetical protein